MSRGTSSPTTASRPADEQATMSSGAPSPLVQSVSISIRSSSMSLRQAAHVALATGLHAEDADLERVQAEAQRAAQRIVGREIEQRAGGGDFVQGLGLPRPLRDLIQRKLVRARVREDNHLPGVARRTAAGARVAKDAGCDVVVELWVKVEKFDLFALECRVCRAQRNEPRHLILESAIACEVQPSELDRILLLQ